MKVLAVFPKEQGGSQLLSSNQALALHHLLEQNEHDLSVLDEDSFDQIDKELENADVVISSPFYPVYMNAEQIQSSQQLKLIITAGVGSDHIDLEAAQNNNVTVAEITGSNVVSVAEHSVMELLILFRNFKEGHRQANEGEWNLPKVGAKAHDIEGKTVGIFGLGQIGRLTMERLQPFHVNLIYNSPHRHEDVEEQYGAEYVSFDDLLSRSDAVSIHSPLVSDTEELFNKENLNKMKEGAFLVNTARGKIVEKDAIIEALDQGHIGGFGGDVWYPEPAPEDHPWRQLTSQAMTVHYSGMTIEAQERIGNGVRDILESFMNNEQIDEDKLIVDGGEIQNRSYK